MGRKNKVMNNNTMRIFTETYENEKTGEQVEGITIMIDGKLKQILDIIIQKDEIYNNYTEVIKDIVFTGINNFIEKYK